MTNQTYLLDDKDKPKSKGRWLMRLLKFVFIIIAFFLIIFTVLANMGGTNETLHGGVEDFVRELSGGYPVKLEKLNNMSFFPRIGVDAQGLEILSSPESKVPIVSIGRVQAFMGFWKVATQDPRFSSIYLEDVRAIKGVFGPNELYIEKIFIDHDIESETAVLRGNGKSGIHPWTMSMGLDVFGKNGKYTYRMPYKAQILFNIADVHFEAMFENNRDGFYKLEDFTLKSQDHKITGNLVLSALGKRLLKLKGTLDFNDGAASLTPEFVIDFAQQPTKLSGDLVSDTISLEDVIGEKSAFKVFTRLRELLGYTAFKHKTDERTGLFSRYDFDFRVALKKFDMNATNTQDVEFSVLQNKNMAKIGPVVSGKGQLLPAVLMMQLDADSDISVLFQSGDFSADFLKAVFPSVSDSFTQDEDIICGLASLSSDEEGHKVNSFGINLRSGDSIVLQNTVLSREDTIQSLVFDRVMNPQNLQKIELSQQGFDFVQSSFAMSGADNGCEAYIFAAPEAIVDTEKQPVSAEAINTP